MRKIIWCFLLCIGLWSAGLLWFVGQIPMQPSTDSRTADAIIALTGGSNRLDYGLQLLADGKGKKLFISGVHDNITIEDLIRRASPEIRAKLTPELATRITLGHEAENTIGNAEETSRWLQKTGGKSIRLVTANYHMPRSIEEFTHALPTTTIIPSPVLPGDFSADNWWKTSETRTLVLLEYHKFLASKLRHLVVSATRHA